MQSFSRLFHSYSLAVGGDIAEWDFMVIFSFFLAEWGLLRAGFAEIVLLHEAWPTASEFRRDRSSRFYYLQHFAGKCGICMPEVIGTQWLFLHIFSMCSFSVPCSSSQTSSGGSC